MVFLAGARLVTPARTLSPGWAEIRDGRIAAVGCGTPPERGVDLGGAWVLPGFIDVHVHGGGGHDFAASPAEMSDGLAFHRANGTTRTLVSLSTAPLADLCERLSWVAALTRRGAHPDGHVVGAHLEGPFLSPTDRRGAHNLAHLQPAEDHRVRRLIDAGDGCLRMVTLAPELAGAMDAIAALAREGVIVAVGHTDATYAQATAAFAAGATVATHLFNGMRPIHHREPGPVLAALNAGAYCEIIADGVHVDHAVLQMMAQRYPDRLVLITDAIRAAGLPDGSFPLAGRTIVVCDGQARLAETGGLAGSTLTMAEALRRAVLEAGVPIEVAAAAAAANPAKLLGIAGRCGSVEPGHDADLVVLGDDLRVGRVMAAGSWLS
jgi:N-acetylglucosamine-6-phosphate deacetylase